MIIDKEIINIIEIKKQLIKYRENCKGTRNKTVNFLMEVERKYDELINKSFEYGDDDTYLREYINDIKTIIYKKTLK